MDTNTYTHAHQHTHPYTHTHTPVIGLNDQQRGPFAVTPSMELLGIEALMQRRTVQHRPDLVAHRCKDLVHLHVQCEYRRGTHGHGNIWRPLGRASRSETHHTHVHRRQQRTSSHNGPSNTTHARGTLPLAPAPLPQARHGNAQPHTIYIQCNTHPMQQGRPCRVHDPRVAR